MAFALHIEPFVASDADPGGTLSRFTRYIERMKQLFQLVFRKADGSPYSPSNAEKKAMLLFRGGDDMQSLFDHVGKVVDADSFDDAVAKIENALKSRTNNVVQRNMLLTRYPQGAKSFEKWSVEVSNAAKLIDYSNYDWKMAVVDAIVLQTSNEKLREKALYGNVTYDRLMTLGVAKEQSEKGSALLSGNLKIKEEEVAKLQQGLKKQSKSSKCSRCGYDKCPGSKKCPANGKTCAKCKKLNHFAQACRSKNNTSDINQLSDSETEEDLLGRILEVKKLSNEGIAAKVTIKAYEDNSNNGQAVELSTDTGVRKTLLNKYDWEKIKSSASLVKTSKLFRPYGTRYHLPIIGRAYITMKAENGASIDTWVYIVNSYKESSLLGESDAVRLGIVTINLKGASEEVTVQKVDFLTKSALSEKDPMPSKQFQRQIDDTMEAIKRKYKDVFSDSTGKFKGPPIRINVTKDVTPVVQPRRRIPLHYRDRLEAELKKMLEEDIIEGPLDEEEPGTFISNLVITDKKDTDQIRVTLDCQCVNKFIQPTHEPIPTSGELRHQLLGSDRFSKLDMTNCYYQFEIEESARKLYAFRTPWGIYRYKRMVMGTSPASSEVQKKIREILKSCHNVIHIKDDIIVHGKGEEHDRYLESALSVLQSNGFTLRPKKCDLGKPEIIWFGNVFSKYGMSPDPEKCNIIHQ